MILIVIGVVVFKLFESKEGKAIKASAPLITNATMTTDATATPPPSDAKTHWVTEWEQYTGIALLVLSLSMDGVLGAVQDRIKANSSPTFRQMMLSFSGWCCIITALIILVTGEVIDVFHFVHRHPKVLLHLLSLGCAAAVGQIFIFTMVSSFGSLACSVTTTVRKFFSVVFSIIFFQNPSTVVQWTGAVLVFTGLLADAFFGKGRPKQTDEKADAEMVEVNEKLLLEQQNNQPAAEPKGTVESQAQNVV